MKLLVIPDVHGIDTWRSQVANAIISSDTHIVFLGDYVDSFVADAWTIFENLKDIIEFKVKYPEKVTLLLGNHDYAYIYGKSSISGHNYEMAHEYKRIFENNRELWKVAWGFQGKERYTLVTHAGLTQYFFDAIIKSINNPKSVMHELLVTKATEPWKKLPIHELLNYFIDQVSYMWMVGYYRGGNDRTGSILWADMNELTTDRLPGIDQIVGHTVNWQVISKLIDGDRIYFTDVHSENKQYLTGFMIDLI